MKLNKFLIPHKNIRENLNSEYGITIGLSKMPMILDHNQDYCLGLNIHLGHKIIHLGLHIVNET